MVACRLALALPRVTAMKLYKFYHAEHHAHSVIGDEQVRRGNNSKGFQDVYPKAKARIWP